MNNKIRLSHLKSRSGPLLIDTPDHLDWLAQDFDVHRLSSSELRQFLSEHHVRYSSTASRSDLIEAFQSRVLPRRRDVKISRWIQSAKPSRLE